MSSHTASKEASAITPRQKFQGHTRIVRGVVHLPDGQRIITCSHDGSLRVWNLESGKQIGEDWRDGGSGVYTIALSPDGKKMVSGGEDDAVRLWDIETCKVVAKWTGHREIVLSVCWSRDGRRVVSGSYDGTARQWDVENGEAILQPIKTGHRYVYAAIYSSDMTLIVTATNLSDGNSESPIKIWDANTGELVTTLKGHTNWVSCLAWTADGKTLISGSFDHSIRTWNTTTWQQIAVLMEHTSSVLAIAISPNDRILASASLDETARLWNLDSGQPISSPLQHSQNNKPRVSLPPPEPHSAVYSISYSADGKLLATSCNDNNAYTWDVAAILREVGLENLLLDPDEDDKALLDVDATQCPGQRRRPAHRVLLGFFLTWARSLLTQRRRNGDGIELVEVPYARGKRSNASAKEKRKTNRLPPKDAAAGSSRPPQSGVTQQSSGVAHLQPSSQPQAAASSTHTVAFISAAPTSTTSRPDATIRQPGRWTRFWLFTCCASPEYTDGRH